MRLSRIAVMLSWAVVGAGAQTTSPTAADATVLPPGVFRFQGGVDWTRIDAIFGPGGRSTLPVGSLLTTDLDATVLPMLLPAQFAAQTLTGSSSVQLVLGTLTADADSRIARIPVSLEYGLTKRITIGIKVPIVDTRTIVTAQLNGRKDSSANVGVNPAGYLRSSAAFGANLQVTSALETAQQQLQQMITTCAASPASSGCPALNARLAEANALLADASDFTAAAIALYGTSVSTPGEPFVPLAGGAIQQGVDAHLAAIRAGFSSFSVSGGSGALVGAKAFAANKELGETIASDQFGIGLDSIGSTQQLTIGDIELSVASQLFNSFTDSVTPGLKLRGAVTGVVRLGTGQTPRAGRPFDIGTGDGQTDLEARGAVDILFANRLLTTVAATYTQQLGSVAYTRLPYSPDFVFILDAPVAGSIKPGNMATVRVNPRVLITRGLMVGGLYNFAHRGADQVTITGVGPAGLTFGNPSPINTWAAGATISYSNLATHSGTGDPSFPAELLFTHLETLGATTSGAEKSFRDTIELRIYFRRCP